MGEKMDKDVQVPMLRVDMKQSLLAQKIHSSFSTKKSIYTTYTKGNEKEIKVCHQEKMN